MGGFIKKNKNNVIAQTCGREIEFNILVFNKMDMKAAFLQGELEEEIYTNQLEGFHENYWKDLICKLKKSIRGLKHSL